MSAIHIHRLTKSFGAHTVLNDISLEIRHGEFIAILGPSGCGKTTLLRTLAGFETVDSGSITVADQLYSSSGSHLPPEKRDLSIVFQNYALWPHMTVAQNVEYSLKVKRITVAERRLRVHSALETVGLAGFEDRNPAELSGGQRQRVALARCLVARPKVVLLDEPLANLDVHLRASMEQEFSRFHQLSGATLIYITHDQQEAMALADRIVVMEAGQVLQFATPQMLYREPANEQVARFIDDGRVAPVQEIEPDRQGAWVTLLGARFLLRARPDQAVALSGQICLHAADLRLAEPGEPAFPVVVKRIIYRGGYSQLEVAAVADTQLLFTFTLTETAALRTGDRLLLTVQDGWVIPSFTE